MAKFYLDTEFCEGFKKPFKWLPTIGKFNKPYHTIELISIGLVDENDRTYYAISKDFDIDWAWGRYQIDHSGRYPKKVYWLRENVLRPIYQELLTEQRYAREYHPALVYPFCKRTLKTLIKWSGKRKQKIASDIIEFIFDADGTGFKSWQGFSDDYYKALCNNDKFEKPEIYAHYCNYDWVVFCSLFGNMSELPKSFPMYCRDLKHMMDETAIKAQPKSKDTSWLSLHPYYPRHGNEHNALADAKFNKQLHEFLHKLQALWDTKDTMH